MGFKKLQREHLPQLMGYMVLVYFAVLMLFSYNSQRATESLARDAVERQFNRQLLVINQRYKIIESELQHAVSLPGFEAYYANRALGMSFQYGLNASLKKLEDQLYDSIYRGSLAELVSSVQLHDHLYDYQRSLYGTAASPICNLSSEVTDVDRVVFTGAYLCIEKPIIYKGWVVGTVLFELDSSQIEFDHIEKGSQLYLVAPEGNSWKWNKITERWFLSNESTEKLESQRDVEEQRFFQRYIWLKGTLLNEQLLVYKTVDLRQVIAFAHRPIFLAFLAGLAVLVGFGAIKAIRVSRENAALAAQIETELVQKKKLKKHNERLKREIEHRTALENQIAYQAHHDNLTKLPNRNFIHKQIDDALVRARRSGGLVCVMFCDLDRFKQVNDTLGHDAGDELLVDAAERFEKIVEGFGTVARFGGDEFLILLEQMDNREEIEDVAQDIVAQFCLPFLVNQHDFSISTSVGCAVYPSDGLISTDLIKRADTALYRAKAAGRATYSFYQQSLDHEMHQQLLLQQRLLQRDWDKQFYLVYQPIVNLKTGDVFAVEVLLRWNSGFDYPIGPDRFIPIAEELGLIGDIGAWVIHRAAEAIAEVLPAPIKVYVNVSPIQLAWRYSLSEVIDQSLARSTYPLERLGLEVTEGCLVHNSEQVQGMLDGLASRGISLSIDDFGTGYSSLSYVSKFAFDVLKIDKSFIRDISDDSEAHALVSAIVAMAKVMNLKIIAEGVETEEQLSMMRDLGCDYIQGYYLAKPMELERIEAVLPDIRQKLLSSKF